MFTVAQSSQELKSGWDLVNEALIPLKEMKIDCEGRVVENSKIVDAVLEEAAEHDLVVLGGSSETGLQAVMGTLPHKIAKNAPKPVLVYRARN